jgi:hypothetical protein
VSTWNSSSAPRAATTTGVDGAFLESTTFFKSVAVG